MATKPLKILSLPVDRGGCGWYRIRQPFEMINRHTNAKAHVLDTEDPEKWLEALCEADILVMRQGAERGPEMLIPGVNAYAKAHNKQPFHAKIVLDIDDNIELINPYSEHYKEYGVTEFYDRNAKVKLWENGKNNFNLVKNRSRVLSLLYGLHTADLVTVTTEKLAAYARQYNEHVAITPNAIDITKWWKPDFTPNKQLRVMWSGGMSHYTDWYSIKEPLNKLMRKYQFKLIMGGCAFEGVIDKDLHYLVETYEWVPFEAHSYRSMLTQADIAIIPLADEPFNHYKSAIKLYEMAAMGVPSVVANILPYSESGIKNALYYSDAEQFTIALEHFLLTEPSRMQIGMDAQIEVLTKWNAQQHASTFLNAYRSILK